MRRSSYEGYRTEYDDYASFRGVTPTAPSVEKFVNPRTESMSRHGSPIQKDNAKERAVSPGSCPIIGEGATVFTDMTDTMLKVLDRQMANSAQAREFENSLVENVGIMGQTGQKTTQYLQDTDSYGSLTTQPLCMNTLPGATGISVPVAESTPVPHVGPTLFRPIPTPRVHDILDPLSNEQARADYLDKQMRYMKSV